MEFIRPDTKFDFLRHSRIAIIASLVMIVIGAASLVIQGGPRLGIDFAGGTLIQVKFDTSTTAGDIRSALRQTDMAGSLIQQFGTAHENEFLIRTEMSGTELEGLAELVEGALAAHFGAEHVDIRRVEVVGAAVGKDLRQKGMLSIVYAMIGMLIYITWRFELRFAVGAITALVHDILVTVGAFSLLDKEFSLAVIAALLTIIGYSLNDTIVVFDRIRENAKGVGGKQLHEVVNLSINQTLSRTLLTSFTTLLVVIALFFLGGAVIHDFAFALMIGIIVGTYSSIFIASPVALAWERLWPLSAKKKKR
ncbi:MAG: protein translocase subunit SecF [Syntrophales bacterium]|jgi:preprotein translocase subunit SecF|nr:protein translocase subunit SecF [Syntrophales bacterium]MCK9527140.1 protein translocase subunit SecF [Syntrophales bacterium]MDX9921735.1 protein translocase subunit SecF [Syntrophales bacterium]